jgi:hypothetical protein
VRNDNLTGGGLAAGDLRAGSVESSEVANNPLTGADIGEATLGQVPSARLGGIGRSARVNNCDPESGLFVACAFTQLDVPPSGARALVLGDVSTGTDGGEDSGIGDCQIHVDRLGGGLPDTRRTFKINDADDPTSASSLALRPRCRPA